jgi:hypothetical protein
VSVDAIMERRRERRWSSPLRPLDRGDLFCLFDQRGTWEWLAHPDDAAFYLERGIVVNGARYDVEKIDEWPLMGAWQLRVFVPDRADSGFIEANAA